MATGALLWASAQSKGDSLMKQSRSSSMFIGLAAGVVLAAAAGVLMGQ